MSGFGLGGNRLAARGIDTDTYRRAPAPGRELRGGRARHRISDTVARDTAIACVRAYRENLRVYSKMSPLEVWYSRLDTQTLLENATYGSTASAWWTLR